MNEDTNVFLFIIIIILLFGAGAVLSGLTFIFWIVVILVILGAIILGINKLLHGTKESYKKNPIATIIIGGFILLGILALFANKSAQTGTLNPNYLQNTTPSSDIYMPTATPTPTPAPAFPSEMSGTANTTWIPQADGTYNIVFTFPNPSGMNVSLAINPTEWADPGPIADTNGSRWTFTNVPANSTQYVNMKAMINETWSQVESWTINVPAWVAPIQ
jgi:hypothetical protein